MAIRAPDGANKNDNNSSKCNSDNNIIFRIAIKNPNHYDNDEITVPVN